MENRLTVCDREALGHAARRALVYLQTVGSRRVAPCPSALLELDQFEEPLPEAPGDNFCVLDLLDRVGSPATVATAGGRFFGFVNGAALPVSVAATWIASAWDQNAALRVMSPAAAALEDVALRWVRDTLRLPPECGGAPGTLGSSASRNPSPSKLKAKTVSIIARPGKISKWGALKTLFRSVPSIVPHSGFGGCWPSPRNPSAAASSIPLAMPSVPATINGVRELGRTER